MVVLYPSGTAFTDDQRARALSAPIVDPLWMLARQWQTGGFLAGDGGTPVHVRLAHLSTQLTVDGAFVAGPLEPAVEAEPIPAPQNLNTATRARSAAELFRLFSDQALAGTTITDIRQALARA